MYKRDFKGTADSEVSYGTAQSKMKGGKALSYIGAFAGAGVAAFVGLEFVMDEGPVYMATKDEVGEMMQDVYQDSEMDWDENVEMSEWWDQNTWRQDVFDINTDEVIYQKMEVYKKGTAFHNEPEQDLLRMIGYEDKIMIEPTTPVEEAGDAPSISTTLGVDVIISDDVESFANQTTYPVSEDEILQD